jgi:hypothetical protein
MKHVVYISKTIPAKAANHPSAGDSLKGFITDPIQTIRVHLGKV